MANLRYGIVTYKGRRAGILREEADGGTSFRYDDGFSETIACAFPIEEGREFRDENGLLPFFAHLGPEGWLRERQSAYADVDSEDDFGILLRFGRDCVGAVGILDPEKQDIELKNLTSTLDKAATETDRTISGVQAKILCVQDGQVIRPAGPEGAARLIAKFPKHDLEGMVRNEATSLELCALLLGKEEVNAAQVGMVESIDGVALIIHRFDRAGDEKLRCEDFMQVLSKRPGKDHRGKYNATYEDLGKALRYSSAIVLDQRRAFLRLVAYVLTGNVDCHMKNWSLLETDTGMRLSPVYDVLNGYIYGSKGYTTRFGLLIGDERKQWQAYDRPLLLSVADRMGLPRRVAEAALKSLERRKTPFFDRLGRPVGMDESLTYEYRASVGEAWERLYG